MGFRAERRLQARPQKARGTAAEREEPHLALNSNSKLETVPVSDRHPAGIAGDAALQNACLYSEAQGVRTCCACPVHHGNEHRSPCAREDRWPSTDLYASTKPRGRLRRRDSGSRSQTERFRSQCSQSCSCKADAPAPGNIGKLACSQESNQDASSFLGAMKATGASDLQGKTGSRPRQCLPLTRRIHGAGNVREGAVEAAISYHSSPSKTRGRCPLSQLRPRGECERVAS